MTDLQNTPEWHAARCGKATASRISEVVARTKTGWGASRDNYASELVYERITGKPYPAYVNKAMEDGTARQPAAIAAYEMLMDCDVEPVGFVPHPTIAMSGASPDGRVGDGGLVEIKCPTLKTHFGTLTGASVSREYLLQMNWQMACDPQRQWCDFVSFFPDDDLPPTMQFFRRRFFRDDVSIAALELEVIAFLGEVEMKFCTLRSRYQLREVLKEAAEAA